MNLRLKLTSLPSLDSDLPKNLVREGRFLLPLVALALRYFKVRSVQQFLTLLQRLFPPCSEPVSLELLSEWVDQECRGTWVEALCLENSLLLWHLLQRLGVPAELRLGVRMRAREFSAHAWVEWEGKPVRSGPYDPSPHYRALSL